MNDLEKEANPPVYFTQDMAEISWSVSEYGLDDVYINVDFNDGEPIFSVVHADTAKALPLYTKPVQKYFYNRE